MADDKVLTPEQESRYEQNWMTWLATNREGAVAPHAVALWSMVKALRAKVAALEKKYDQLHEQHMHTQGNLGRMLELEAELARVRPVAKAACAWYQSSIEDRPDFEGDLCIATHAFIAKSASEGPKEERT